MQIDSLPDTALCNAQPSCVPTNWFKHFQSRNDCSHAKENALMEIDVDSDDTLHLQDDDEHSHILYVSDEDIPDDVDGKHLREPLATHVDETLTGDCRKPYGHEEDIANDTEAHSDDNVTFYDSEGRFLFKLR